MASMPGWVTDYQCCTGHASLKAVLSGIDRLGYRVVAVTQILDAFTVFFERPEVG